MRTIGAAKFKEQCLALLDDVDEEGIVITKRGKPVAKLVPIRRHPSEFIGSLPDIIVDPDDDLLSTGIAWEAELPDDPVEREKFIEERRMMAYPYRKQEQATADRSARNEPEG